MVKSAGRTGRILGMLRNAYPDAGCALLHESAFELLIATILSAQCTDERVNVVTRRLFEKYRTPRDYVRVRQNELENDIRPTGFFRNKARNIQGACSAILDRFHGQIPQEMDDLLLLPGVARKTANVVLGVAYGKAEGVVVDTHVFRVARRLDLSHAATPEKMETGLMKIVPRSQWIAFSHRMILHGRRICKARKPLCPACPIEAECRSQDKVPAGNFRRLRPSPAIG